MTIAETPVQTMHFNSATRLPSDDTQKPTPNLSAATVLTVPSKDHGEGTL